MAEMTMTDSVIDKLRREIADLESGVRSLYSRLLTAEEENRMLRRTLLAFHTPTETTCPKGKSRSDHR